MKDKCPNCHKIVEIAGYGEKKCPKCGGGIFITPDESDKGIIHFVVNLRAMGLPVQGDIFIDAQHILETLPNLSLEELFPMFGNILQSLLSKK